MCGIYLGIKELLNDEQMIRLPLTGVIWSNFQVKRLEGIVRVDRNLALEVLHFECYYTWFPCVQVGEVLLCPNDVLQLPSHEDTTKESMHWGHQATGAGAR